MTTTEVQAEREAIDRAVDGRTICDLLLDDARRYAARPAVSWKEGGAWRSLSWAEYRDRAARAAMGLRSLGVGRGDFVAIMARNRPEHLLADLGALHAGATPVSLYNTLPPEQIAYVAGHCEARVAVVENAEFLRRWEKAWADLSALEHVVLIDDDREAGARATSASATSTSADGSPAGGATAGGTGAGGRILSWADLLDRGASALAAPGGREEFDRTWGEVRPDDLATLVYTSGTTGPPKGVMLTHRNVLWTCQSLDRTGQYAAGLRAISYLPLAHALERLATHYLSMFKAAHVHFCPELLRVFEYVPEIRPEAFAGVPRLYEKLQAGILAKLAEEPNERRRRIARHAVDVGRRAVALEQAARPVPVALRAQRALFDRVVHARIRRTLGLDRCRLLVSGAAPISRDVLEFFWGIGLRVVEGYGMTESSAPATIGDEGSPIGTVGRQMPGCEVALAPDGEVLIRGGNVSPGYYRDPERTAETFDADGWLHSGDIGVLDRRGNLRIVDRKKELIITAGGKNVSPSNLEALMKRSPLIGQVVAVGDGRPYVGALIVLDAEIAPAWARENGVPFADLASFSREPRVWAEVQQAVDEANQHLSQAESVRRFAILPSEWTVDSEELTPTLKLKRRVIHAKYAAEIDSLYA
jgi:long-chain acyl-CoA synthetase